jgi:signal transduction histidine kinase
MTLDKLPKVWADTTQLKQVLYNLVGNAAKFTDVGGIAISATSDAGFVKVIVTDTGRGIAVESKKLLFRKFQQAGSSLLTRDTTRGTGLGLYICRLMMDNMGGSIVLEHTKVGHGSSFSITIPVATNKLRELADPRQNVDTTTGLITAGTPLR